MPIALKIDIPCSDFVFEGTCKACYSAEASTDSIKLGLGLSRGYGSSGPFRQPLSERGLLWAVGLLRRQNVYPADIGLVFPVVASRHMQLLPLAFSDECYSATITSGLTPTCYIEQITWQVHGSSSAIRPFPGDVMVLLMVPSISHR